MAKKPTKRLASPAPESRRPPGPRTKRYWVDWENAATRVGGRSPDDGWSLADEDQAQRRFTQRGYEAGEPMESLPMPPPAAEAVPTPAHRARRQSSHPSHAEEAAAQPGFAAQELDNRATRPRPQQEPPPAAEVHGQTQVVSQPQPPIDSDKVQVQDQPRALIRAEDPPDVAVATHNFPAELATDPRLILMRSPDSPQAAAYRVLRHHVVQQGNPQVIVVASAREGEGKTTCAVNLALAFAECRRSRVLLVDANFRRPQLSTVFRFKPPWCFAEQLIEHRDRPMSQWSVVEVAPFGLHVVAANPRPEPVRDAPAFAFAMERLRAAGYDYIVIDAPAVLGGAEVNLLQDAADGVLLVSRAGSSRRAELRASIEQLAPAPILGVALIEG